MTGARRGRKRKAVPETFSLSFLDAICCGFGAVILLLVLTKLGEPRAIEQARLDLDQLIVRLTEELDEIRGETTKRNRELTVKREQLIEERRSLARLRGDLTRIRGEFAATVELEEVDEAVEAELRSAQQELTEEMKRLQAQQRAPQRRVPDAPVGGIPVDSEYIIFIIDTSGSMKRYAWPLAVEKMRQTLEIYPRVKGIQVMNDMGQYMFSRYAGRWIPDTRARRKAILDRLRSWEAFSNSSPVEGITTAIKTFAKGDKRISLYVFGDEFTGDSIDNVLRTVRRINRADRSGERLVRIHAVGFPVMFTVNNVSDVTGVRFATLMRTLCKENGGTFVALNTTRT